jgi:AcrR family transcriptional regulator
LILGGASIDAVTAERVSARAGIGTGSFYEYFTGKDSLIGVRRAFNGGHMAACGRAGRSAGRQGRR